MSNFENITDCIMDQRWAAAATKALNWLKNSSHEDQIEYLSTVFLATYKHGRLDQAHKQSHAKA